MLIVKLFRTYDDESNDHNTIVVEVDGVDIRTVRIFFRALPDCFKGSRGRF